MPRLPLVDVASAPPAVREGLAALPPQATVYRMVAHAETLFRPFLELSGLIQTQLQLDARLRQLAILHVSVITGCDYERVQHEVIATLEGVTDEQIAAVAQGRLDGPEFDPREATVLRFVNEVVEQRGASAATTGAIQELFTPREIVELLMVVWQYLGLALLLNTTGLEPEPPLDPELIRETRARRAALGS
jgi:4-carboxymuconolactone decarboxylase